MSWLTALAFMITVSAALGMSGLVWNVDTRNRPENRAEERRRAALRWPWGRASAADLRHTLAGHERLAREHARDAARFLAWRNYDSYLTHLQWQRWHERKADKLRRRIADLERKIH
jgi:hypothetical protein